MTLENGFKLWISKDFKMTKKSNLKDFSPPYLSITSSRARGNDKR
jgi:hypothetical protein